MIIAVMDCGSCVVKLCFLAECYCYRACTKQNDAKRTWCDIAQVPLLHKSNRLCPVCHTHWQLVVRVTVDFRASVSSIQLPTSDVWSLMFHFCVVTLFKLPLPVFGKNLRQ